MANDTYLWIISYSQHCFLWNFVFYSRKAYLAHQYKKMLYHPYSYRITIDEHTISLQRICVLSYLCLLLTKVLFETSLKSFQHNTEGRRLSNFSIKLILFSHFCSMCKGLCQNKKNEFDKYTKGGQFCAAHMALTSNNLKVRGLVVAVSQFEWRHYAVAPWREVTAKVSWQSVWFGIQTVLKNLKFN